jgi:hypothetical protein
MFGCGFIKSFYYEETSDTKPKHVDKATVPRVSSETVEFK